MEFCFKLSVILAFFLFCGSRLSSGMPVSDLEKLMMKQLEDRGEMFHEVNVEDKNEAVEISKKAEVDKGLAEMLNDIMMKQVTEKPNYIRQETWFTADGGIRGTSDKYGDKTTPPPTTTSPMTTASTGVEKTTRRQSMKEFWKFWMLFNRLV